MNYVNKISKELLTWETQTFSETFMTGPYLGWICMTILYFLLHVVYGAWKYCLNFGQRQLERRGIFLATKTWLRRGVYSTNVVYEGTMLIIRLLFKKCLVYKDVETFLNDFRFSDDFYDSEISKVKLTFLIKYADADIQEYQLLVYMDKIANQNDFNKAMIKNKMFSETDYTSFKLKLIDFVLYKQS